MTTSRQSQNQVSRIRPHAASVALALTFLLAIAAQSAQAQTFSVLHTFTGAGDGHSPYAGVTLDRAGNLYGTTTDSGGPGTVFVLKRRNGSWILNTLFTFTESSGNLPFGGVVFGPDGALYGTTSEGGNQGGCGEDICGSVYSLRPQAQACPTALCPWDITVLHLFKGSGDGANPGAVNPVFDAAGNLYGTTIEGGLSGEGTVFQLTPSGGSWTEKIIYPFGGNPNSGVIIDKAGNLYGTFPGLNGAVYELSPSGSGWALSTLYTFQGGADGSGPFGPLIMDTVGNVYGTTVSGGAGGGGTVFELSPSGGSWTFSLLYSLSGRSKGGPQGSLALDTAGNLYGTAVTDGANECGSVFKLTHTVNGWTYTDLHDFTCRSDGQAPYGGVTLDSGGNIYGTAAYGGMFGGDCFGPGGVGCGVVWEITQ